jgi:hypothetical protein
MNENLSGQARLRAADASPSNSTVVSSCSSLSNRERVSRAQAAVLRPGDQIAAPGRPVSAFYSVIAADLVRESDGGSINPIREEDQ